MGESKFIPFRAWTSPGMLMRNYGNVDTLRQKPTDRSEIFKRQRFAQENGYTYGHFS